MTTISRSWAPDENDHFIYRWVKFERNTQKWVADLLGVSQGTISRTIARYERRQTRAEAQADGRLTQAERLRAQRWLTFERNERILSSCLRIAGEMEGCVDVSRSTIQRPVGQPDAEKQIRTVHSTLDRHGIAARFLRLAYRINMDQLKLSQEEDPAPLPPLSAEQLAAEEAAAEQQRREAAAARKWAGQSVGQSVVGKSVGQSLGESVASSSVTDQPTTDQMADWEQAERLELAKEILEQHAAGAGGLEKAAAEAALVLRAAEPDSPLLGAHNAHNAGTQDAVATDCSDSTCGENQPSSKKTRHARMNGSAASPQPDCRQRQGQPAVAEMRVSPQQAGVVVESG